MFQIILILFPILASGSLYDPIKSEDFLYAKFPPGFKWGMASASYNYEGGWDADGKGLSIWDVFTHKDPSPIADGSTGDVASDSYHKYKEDVQLLKDMNAGVYRFSISWPRILPKGTMEVVNELGIDYYDNLIDELVANGIEPLVTLYHWDLPQELQIIGGWLNKTIAQNFENYARLAFDRFGDRVKNWLTLNEPLTYCLTGLSDGTQAPGIREPLEAPYTCVHNSILSHAAAYRVYEQEFKEDQGGRCGITLDTAWYEPLDPTNSSDVEAAERSQQFALGWLANPILYGEYPPVMREFVDRKSIEEGRNVSRLPNFTPEQSNLIKGTFDFLGLNTYTSELITSKELPSGNGWYSDQDVSGSYDPSWYPAASPWLKVNPWGFRKLLIWIKDRYDNPEIIVTENGISDDGHVGLNDARRISYFKNYINQMLKAVVLDGCNITGYMGWTLLDSFAMNMGFSIKFGVHHVNFSDPERPRTPKDSAFYLKKIFTDNGFEPEPEQEMINGVFPPDFKWGMATASYQIEGAWNVDGKGENIWDNFTHRDPSPIDGGATGDVACDSYNKFREDVQLLKDVGVDYYRFSVSWSRILPKGTLAGGVNLQGINFYNELIDELILNGIEPMITLFHWDTPQPIEDLGGFLEESAIVPHFTDYAEIVFQAFGDRVKKFITFNEPVIVCVYGYEIGEHAPGLQITENIYNCAHNLIKAHASAYRLYESSFKPEQGGMVGITLDTAWFEPEIPQLPEYVEASERSLQFYHGWFARPIFYGSYPQQMIDFVGSNLPKFDEKWTLIVNGSYDFLGLNHYTTEIAYPTEGGVAGTWFGDQMLSTYQEPSWPNSASTWLKVTPWGFRKLLNWIKDTYNNPLLYVTENGFSDFEHVGVNDTKRGDYYRDYIYEMLKAVLEDGCNIKAYTAWTLMDNFEWARGYTERFGIHAVNFTDPTRPRSPKSSASVLKTIFSNNGFPPSNN